VGIPIVPIVIRNAEVIAARDSSTFNPGTVDVAVYPPIPVDDWTLEDLPDRIAAIRQLYLDTLKDWPHDKLPDVDLSGPRRAPTKAKAKTTDAKRAEAPKPEPKKTAAHKTEAKETEAKKAPVKKDKTAADKAAKADPNSPAESETGAKGRS
jgi:putative phosphoserine phosphatase / 1-acylglycerol-3-phosphate O-acyltransferase